MHSQIFLLSCKSYLSIALQDSFLLKIPIPNKNIEYLRNFSEASQFEDDSSTVTTFSPVIQNEVDIFITNKIWKVV